MCRFGAINVELGNKVKYVFLFYVHSISKCGFQSHTVYNVSTYSVLDYYHI